MRVKQLRNGDCGKLQDQLAKYVSDNIGKLTSADNWQDIIKDNKEIQRFLKNLLGITKEEDMKRFYQILNNAIGPIIGEEKRRQTIQKITGALSVFSIAGIALLVTGVVALPVGLSIAGAGVIGAGASGLTALHFIKKNNIAKQEKIESILKESGVNDIINKKARITPDKNVNNEVEKLKKILKNCKRHIKSYLV